MILRIIILICIFVLKSDGFSKELLIKPCMKEPITSELRGLNFMEKIEYKNGHHNATHGLSKHPIHSIWTNIKSRCYNKNVPHFKTYGARGIKVCDEWKGDFKAFYDYVISLPDYDESKLNGIRGITLDRKNNDRDYAPKNLRWASMIKQAGNKNKKWQTSKYTGVWRSSLSGKWHAKICVGKKQKFIGSFWSEILAVNARNKYIIANNLTEYAIQ